MTSRRTSTVAVTDGGITVAAGEDASVITVRVASGEDAAELAAFARALFTSTFGHLYSEADLSSYLDETHALPVVTGWVSGGSSRACLAVTPAGHIVGYTLAGPCTLPHSHASSGLTGSPCDSGELKKLYVQRDYCGKGVADALMAASVGWLRSSFPGRRIFLSVWSDNHRALAFYSKPAWSFACVDEYLYVVGEARDREFIFADSPPDES